MPLRVLVLGTSSVGPAGRSCIRSCRRSSARRRSTSSSPTPKTSPAAAESPRICSTRSASYGVDVVTLGDHIYKKVDIVSTLQHQRADRPPANLSSNAAGRPYTVVPTNTRREGRRVFAARADLHEPPRRRSVCRGRSRPAARSPAACGSASATFTPRPPARRSRWGTGWTAASR